MRTHDETPAWAINVSVFNEATLTVRINSKREISLREGDRYVAFRRRTDEVRFLWYGRIISVARPGEEAAYFLIKVTIDNKFDEPRYLQDYAYSLLRVYRYREPWRHFNRSYTRMVPFDFETIVRGYVFWARTAFGTFANVLPEPKLFEYLRLAAEHRPDWVVRGGDMGAAWSLLKSFIEDEYIASASVFVGAATALRELGQDQEVNIVAERFALAGDGERADPIVIQADHFNAMLTSFRENPDGPIIDQFDRSIEQARPIEERFEQAFKEVQWPLDVIANF